MPINFFELEELSRKIHLSLENTENRALESVEKALNNPLLDVDIEGGRKRGWKGKITRRSGQR